MNIAIILQAQAAKNPKFPAIIDTYRDRPRTTCFADLELAARHVAAMLRQTALKPGDGVLVFYPMSAELYIALAALFRLGLVAMFLDPSAGYDHIEHCCDLFPPKALIASTKAHLLRLRSPALRQIPLKFAIGLPVPGAISWQHAQQLKPAPQFVPCNLNTPALLTFTSGSTGRPKAAVRTHGFLFEQYQVLKETLQLKAGEVDLATLPIFVLANLAAGLTSIIPNVDLRYPGAIAPSPVIEQIKIYKPDRAVASPAFLERLAEYCLQHQITLPSLKKIFSGGAPVMPRSLHQWRQIAPNAQLTIIYGSTEAEPIAHIEYRSIQPIDIAATLKGRGLLVGMPVSAIKIAILRQQWGKPIQALTTTEFKSACLPPETAGEIVVSGKHVLPTYLYKQGNEETKFSVDGTPWHRTGDAGYLDSQGRLWLLGRCHACIQDDRGTLYPFEVEGVAFHHPGIRRSAVISHQGKRILAVELNDLKSKIYLPSLQESLSSHIDMIKVYKKLPLDKRHNAKIDYPALLKLLERQLGD